MEGGTKTSRRSHLLCSSLPRALPFASPTPSASRSCGLVSSSQPHLQQLICMSREKTTAEGITSKRHGSDGREGYRIGRWTRTQPLHDLLQWWWSSRHLELLEPSLIPPPLSSPTYCESKALFPSSSLSWGCSQGFCRGLNLVALASKYCSTLPCSQWFFSWGRGLGWEWDMEKVKVKLGAWIRFDWRLHFRHQSHPDRSKMPSFLLGGTVESEASFVSKAPSIPQTPWNTRQVWKGSEKKKAWVMIAMWVWLDSHGCLCTHRLWAQHAGYPSPPATVKAETKQNGKVFSRVFPRTATAFISLDRRQ